MYHSSTKRLFSVMLLVSVWLAATGLGCGDDDEPEMRNCGDAHCAEPQVCCDGQCVDPMADAQHCGACGAACDDGLLCSDGACVLSCVGATIACDDVCVDPGTSPTHCGATGDCTGDSSGQSCPEGMRCDGTGVCAPTCKAGFTECDGMCFDLNVDVNHCGGCDTACEAGEVCDGSGACALSCPDDLLDCGGSCIDPAKDRDFCGATGSCTGDEVGASCGDGELCDAGVCVPAVVASADVTVATDYAAGMELTLIDREAVATTAMSDGTQVTFPGVTVADDDVVLVFRDAVAQRGALVLRLDDNDDTDLSATDAMVASGELRVYDEASVHEQQVLTDVDLATALRTGSGNAPYSGTAGSITVDSGVLLRVPTDEALTLRSAASFTMEGPLVIAGSLELDTGADLAETSGATVTLGGEMHLSSQSVLDVTGDFVFDGVACGGAGTVRFTGSSSTIRGAEHTSFENLFIASGTTTLDTDGDDGATVGTLTIDTPSNATLELADGETLTAGTVLMPQGTVTVTTGTDSELRVTDQLDVADADFTLAADSRLTLTGTGGTPFVVTGGGTLTTGPGSTVRYESTSGTTSVLPRDYSTLTFSGDAPFSITGMITSAENFVVESGASVDTAGNDVTVGGDLELDGAASLDTGGGTLTVDGDTTVTYQSSLGATTLVLPGPAGGGTSRVSGDGAITAANLVVGDADGVADTVELDSSVEVGTLIVTGDTAGDTLDLRGGVLRILGDVTVGANSTLSASPLSTVVFSADSTVDASGTLQVFDVFIDPQPSSFIQLVNGPMAVGGDLDIVPAPGGSAILQADAPLMVNGDLRLGDDADLIVNDFCGVAGTLMVAGAGTGGDLTVSAAPAAAQVASLVVASNGTVDWGGLGDLGDVSVVDSGTFVTQADTSLFFQPGSTFTIGSGPDTPTVTMQGLTPNGLRLQAAGPGDQVDWNINHISPGATVNFFNVDVVDSDAQGALTIFAPAANSTLTRTINWQLN